MSSPATHAGRAGAAILFPHSTHPCFCHPGQAVRGRGTDEPMKAVAHAFCENASHGHEHGTAVSGFLGFALMRAGEREFPRRAAPGMTELSSNGKEERIAGVSSRRIKMALTCLHVSCNART